MPDLTFSVSRTIDKSGFYDFKSHEVTATMTANGLGAESSQIGTATSAIYTANIDTLGLAFARSLVTSTATTATIEIGRLDGTNLYSFCRLRPNESALLRLAPGDYAAKADADGARLFISIAED